MKNHISSNIRKKEKLHNEVVLSSMSVYIYIYNQTQLKIKLDITHLSNI